MSLKFVFSAAYAKVVIECPNRRIADLILEHYVKDVNEFKVEGV